MEEPARSPLRVNMLDRTVQEMVEQKPVRACAISTPPDAQPIVTAVVDGVNVTLAIRLARGNGTMVVFASDGVAASPQVEACAFALASLSHWHHA